eukprot:5298490-Pleurochrysis_carterae.AAC.2
MATATVSAAATWPQSEPPRRLQPDHSNALPSLAWRKVMARPGGSALGAAAAASDSGRPRLSAQRALG